MEKGRKDEIAGDEGEWRGGGVDSIQQAMRAHCPNYNEASYFFRAERSRSICPRQQRLDDSGPLPGLARNEVQKDRRHFAVIEDRPKRKRHRRRRRRSGGRPQEGWAGGGRRGEGAGCREERKRERRRYILRGNVAVFPAIHGTDRFFWPLLTTHSYLAA